MGAHLGACANLGVGQNYCVLTYSCIGRNNHRVGVFYLYTPLAEVYKIFPSVSFHPVKVHIVAVAHSPLTFVKALMLALGSAGAYTVYKVIGGA